MLINSIASTYNASEGVIISEPSSGMGKQATGSSSRGGGVAPPAGGVAQIQRIADDEREDEMEQNLGQVLIFFTLCLDCLIGLEYVVWLEKYGT